MTNSNIPIYWLSLGSNFYAQHYLAKTVEDLTAKFGELLISPCYKTRPQGITAVNQPSFYNLVVSFNSQLDLTEIQQELAQLTAGLLKRKTDQVYLRTLDIDLLGCSALTATQLKPHSDLSKFNFVLLPLVEIAPNQRAAKDWPSFAQLQQKLCLSPAGMHQVQLNL